MTPTSNPVSVGQYARFLSVPASAGNFPPAFGRGAFNPLSGGCRFAVHAETRTARAGGVGHHRCTLLSAASRRWTVASNSAGCEGATRPALNPSFAQSLGHADFCADSLFPVKAVLKTRALLGRGLGGCAKEVAA